MKNNQASCKDRIQVNNSSKVNESKGTDYRVSYWDVTVTSIDKCIIYIQCFSLRWKHD